MRTPMVHALLRCCGVQDAGELGRCVAEANVYALAAHMYWGTWSFLQVGGGKS